MQRESLCGPRNPWVQGNFLLERFSYIVYSSVQFSRLVMSDTLGPHGLQRARPPCLSPTTRACSNSCPSSRWCHPTISSFVVPFSSCIQSFPVWGSFPMSHFFISGGQNIGVSASAVCRLSPFPTSLSGTKRGQPPLWIKKKLFYWSTVDLQCCVNFCCTEKWFSFIYIYIYILIHIFIVVCSLVTKLWPCDLMDCSLPGSSVHEIFRARKLEWLLFPLPRDLPKAGIEPMSLDGFFTTEPPGKLDVLFHSFSIMVYDRMLNTAPCAMQWDLVVYPSYIW